MTLDDALARLAALERANDELTLERDGARLNYDKLLAEAAARVGAAEARVQADDPIRPLSPPDMFQRMAALVGMEREGARLKSGPVVEALLALIRDWRSPSPPLADRSHTREVLARRACAAELERVLFRLNLHPRVAAGGA